MPLDFFMCVCVGFPEYFFAFMLDPWLKDPF